MLILAEASHVDLSNLTIFTTSLGRPRNLILLAEYLHRYQFNGRFLVIDASSDRNESLTRYAFVDYVHRPRISCQSAFYEALRYSSSAYLVFVGDDDFPLLSGLWECCNLLASKRVDCAFGRSCWIDYRGAHHGISNPQLFTSFLRIPFCHKIDRQLYTVTGPIASRLTSLVKNYRVFQFALLTRHLWGRIYSSGYAAISDIHIQEIASSLAIASISDQQAISGFQFLRGTGHNRPNVLPSDSRHAFPDLGSAESELRSYASKLFGSPAPIDSFVSSCISLRLLQYTDYFRVQEPAKDSIESWILDVLGSKDLLKALAHIAALATNPSQ